MRRETDCHQTTRKESSGGGGTDWGTILSFRSHHLSAAMLSLHRFVLSSPSSVLVRHLRLVPALCSNDSWKKPAEIKAKIDDYEEDKPLNARYRLKVLARDYGSSAFVVHISVSLCSLAMCYATMRAGLPITSIIQFTGYNFSEETFRYLTTGTTFGIAYFVHKCLLPVRLMATAMLTPRVVDTLRQKGILKPMKDRAKKPGSG